MIQVFIDGSAGTTGLRIADRLRARTDVRLLTLPEALRKDVPARREMLNTADVAFLCLPDAAAEEAAALADFGTAVIDTSTAHRTAEGWVYGFPELADLRGRIACSRRVANPGCHASGFLALTEPLVREGLLAPDTALTCFSVTGYSGGGKKMIAEYEAADRPAALDAPRQYALGQTHKHLPEMTRISGLTVTPVFCPVVADYYSGMTVTVPLFARQLRGTAEDVRAVYRAQFRGPVVRYTEHCGAMAGSNDLSGRDDMEISVEGNSERLLLIARFDNLGKGASGAAIQNMNILLGLEETTGLVLEEGTT